MAAAALAVPGPRDPGYGHYLTPEQFRRWYGPTSARAGTVANWLTGQGMKVTAITGHYVAVDATVSETDAGFGTTLVQYDFSPVTIGTFKLPVPPELGTAGGFSVPLTPGARCSSATPARPRAAATARYRRGRYQRRVAAVRRP